MNNEELIRLDYTKFVGKSIDEIIDIMVEIYINNLPKDTRLLPLIRILENAGIITDIHEVTKKYISKRDSKLREIKERKLR